MLQSRKCTLSLVSLSSRPSTMLGYSVIVQRHIIYEKVISLAISMWPAGSVSVFSISV